MIVNDCLRFIFVHVPKTGGTSISQLLGRVRGNNPAVVAPDTKHETLARFFAEVAGRFFVLGRMRARRFNDYFKFGFVRNPWDRTLSLYHYLKEQRPRTEIDSVTSFSDFLRRIEDNVAWIGSLHSMRPQSEFLVCNGALAADFVGRYENLTEDFKTVSRHLGLAGTLPHANRSSNRGQDYRLQYSDHEAEIVARRFAADLSCFHYRFEEFASAGSTC